MFYHAQRKELADAEGLERNRKLEKQGSFQVGYFHSSLTVCLESNVKKEDECQIPRYYLEWRSGSSNANRPEAVKARGGTIITRRVKRTGRNGNYNKGDFSSLLRRYAKWETELAFAFETERVRPIRQYLNYINSLRSQIKWTPPDPLVPAGPVRVKGPGG